MGFDSPPRFARYLALKEVKRMEKDTSKALIIVGIENRNRLNANTTEDFFLVDIKDYNKAIDALEGADDMVFTTSGAMQIFNNAGVDYERIIDGERFFFKNNASVVTFDYETEMED